MLSPFLSLESALAGRYAFGRLPDGDPPLLGRGGMAEVYLANDLRHHRAVAIKVLQPTVARALGSDRFLREIDIAARLSHPNILPLFEAGSTESPDGLPLLWYAMPRVAGGTLRDRLDREGQLPIDDALGIAREIAHALECAHGNDLVHRDIKPENVLIENGRAIVADFGIARAISDASDAITSAGLAVGTPAYMSPEQGAGQPRIDGRSDIYSLGCVLYEMLAGEPPFTGPTAQAVIARHQLEPPRSLQVVRPTVSRALEGLVERALAKVPADRFGSATEFAAALAMPPDRWRRRVALRPARPLAWLLGGLALTGVAFLAWRNARSGEHALDPNRIVVFPVVSTAGTSTDSLLAASATDALLAAFNSTSSLAGIDGRRLPAGGPDSARAVGVGAGHYLQASLLASDSLRVRLELRSTLRDTALMRTIAFGSQTSGWEIGMHAARRLLPLMFPVAHGADLPLLANVPPDALAEFFHAEQRYREAAFTEALGHYWRAVQADSGFALAALRGAYAATWTSQPEQARTLLAIAVTGAAHLPPRFRHLANGLDAYLHGQADSAVSHLRRAARDDPDRADAWMLLGETFTHLLPSESPLDSLAEDAFGRAHRLDPAFTPVLFHLLEIDARRRDTAAGNSALRAFRSGSPDSSELYLAELMMRCATRPLSAGEWRTEVRRHPDAVRAAAQSLSVAGLALPECARGGWQALLDDSTGPDAQAAARRFGALLALQHVLVALGRDADVRALWAADTAFNVGLGQQVLVLDALATGRFAAHADSFTARVLAELAAGDTVVSYSMWLAGSWAARRGNPAALRRVTEALVARSSTGKARIDVLLARSLTAQSVLARGDTAAAISQLRALAPTATETNVLAWSPWESLGYERLLLTELLVKRRRYPEALSAAANFDAPAPLVYAIYLPASLSLRVEAAEAWGAQSVARRSRQRLVELTRGAIR